MLGKLKPKCGRHKVQSEDFEHWLLVAFIHTSLVAQMVLKLLVNKDLVLNWVVVKESAAFTARLHCKETGTINAQKVQTP